MTKQTKTEESNANPKVKNEVDIKPDAINTIENNDNPPKIITNDEALKLANVEIDRLNTVITDNEAMANSIIKEHSDKIEELNNEIKALQETPSNDNFAFIQFLDQLEEGLAQYAGRKSERLRREFVTDLTELITKTKESLK